MKKNDPAMAVCPDCGSRLKISGRVGHSEVYQRIYLCGATYYDRRLHRSTEVCSEIGRLRAERDAAVKELRDRSALSAD